MDFLNEQLESLKKAGLYRALKSLRGPQTATTIIDEKRVLQFSSNNYLGLADHPRLKAAAQEAINNCGSGSGASRLICGNLELNVKLEGKIAKLKKKENALLFNTGYMANIGIISTLMGEEDIILSDEFNHASIIDGCMMSKAQVRVYPHKDMDALEDLLKESKQFKHRLIVTDGIFSMDGDIVSLPELVSLAKQYECMLMVDDAHATGVLGANGGGTGEHFSLEDKIDISMGTFGKALGGFGAFVAGSHMLREFLINRARTFIFTTGLPPAVIASGIAALELLEMEPEIRAKLWENVGFFKNGIKELGFDTLNSETQIIPVLVGDASLTMQMGEMLLKEGVFIQGIRPPAVAQSSSRLRITIMATHARGELEFALKALEKVGKSLGVI
ncbi:MAG: 8-amino-7-oxononanoate synthase [Deltaproteobacteria bacterium]|nr:8-amino-7-oxononanoate synthase [Deltaproteobacteria bacterium]